MTATTQTTSKHLPSQEIDQSQLLKNKYIWQMLISY